MASNFTQADRPLSVNTPLGRDALLLVAFSGKDAMSQPFRYQLDLLAENKTDVAFEKVLGEKVTVTFRWGEKRDKKRFFNGICSRISQGEQDKDFTQYRMEIVPKLWLLTRKAQSRIFQHMTVPDILKKVLTGFDVTYEIKGTFEPRDFCVQYRETDFNFASRLMEEEGIYYFFKHEDGNHTMVVANTPASHPDVPVQSTVIHEVTRGGERDELRITGWEKAQELRSGKYTLFDHCFELPHKHLEAERLIQDSVAAGKVTHKLKVGGNEKLEIYDYPGEYAQRFDGIDKGGGEQPAELQKIFVDNKRTVDIRMAQEALESLRIEGSGNCRQFVSGHKFTLDRHFNANGAYVLTSVEHIFSLSSADFRSGQAVPSYHGRFECIPMALPFRPPRVTPKPVVQGTQSAVVVGPSGEEIFPDKYSRVKVQFHWDREGKNDLDSSCWIRVSTLWAGKQWGMIHIPRIGQEVLVDFLEGDPDQPVIIGSLYNADMMPPYQLPANKTQSGVKSRSSLGGGPANFNEIRFEDKKGQEQLLIHAEKNQDIEVENNETHSVGNDRSKTIGHDETTHVKNNRTETVDKDETITIHGSRTETVDGDEKVSVGGSRTVLVDKGNDTHQMKMGNRNVTIDMGDDTLTIKMGNQTTKLNLGKSTTEAMQGIELKVGQSSVSIDQMGVTIKGMMIKLDGQIMVDVKALLTTVQADAMTQVSGAMTMIKGDGLLTARGGVTMIG
jgi:type VI secretion system secreted protein VgrG